MKVIRKDDRKSNKYITKFDVEKGTRNKAYLEKDIGGITVTTEDYSELVVYMADGSKPRYANIPENKVRVLKLMKDQHSINKTYEKALSYKMRSNIVISVFLGVGCLILTFVMASIVPSQDYLNFVNTLRIVFPTTFLTGTVFYGVAAKHIYNKLKEIQKNDYLLENEEILNEADLENANILENIKSKDKIEISRIKETKDKEDDKQYFDINSIDGLSLKTLKTLKENIEKENFLGLITTQQKKENADARGNQLTKNKKV